MGDERRNYPRYDVMAQIRVYGGRNNYIMDVKNISQTGMFVANAQIKTMPWFRVGQKLEIDLFAAGDLDNLRIAGRVVRLVVDGPRSHLGFGVEFDELEGDILKALLVLMDCAVPASFHPPPLPGRSNRGER